MKYLKLLLLLAFLGCSNLKTNKPERKCIVNDIYVTKFTAIGLGIPVNEESFWKYPYDHASFKIHQSQCENEMSFFESIDTKLSQDDSINFGDLIYAFISKSKVTDTLYADYSLLRWKFKKNGKWEYRYDRDSIYYKPLKEEYSFFSDCW